MKTFCKGAIFGMIAGAGLVSVAIVKDKNFYNMVKEKVDKASCKMSKMVDKIKNKIEENKKKEKICDENCNSDNKKIDEQTEQKYKDCQNNGYYGN
jgi:predicted negative regulator of RcsB-dependent stress response